MSSSSNVLRALDACIEELERMSEAELNAFAQEYHDFAAQRETMTEHASNRRDEWKETCTRYDLPLTDGMGGEQLIVTSKYFGMRTEGVREYTERVRFGVLAA